MDAEEGRGWEDETWDDSTEGVRCDGGGGRFGVARDFVAGGFMTSFAVGSREKDRDLDNDRLGSNWNASLADRDKEISASERSESVGP